MSESEETNGCRQVFDEDRDDAFVDYENNAEVTAAGKYRCRDCGLVFDTLEEHDEHHRQVHSREGFFIAQGMTM